MENGETSEKIPNSREVFLYFLLLGFINIGGPVAQITMMYNKMVEQSQWLSKDRFVKIMGFTHMLPGPEAFKLAIYVGYLKKGILGGILAGLTFIIPGALVMIILSHLYVTYGNLSQVNDVLYILKPAVLGIIGAGIIKLGKAAITNARLAAILITATLAMLFIKIDFLFVLFLAGLVNLLLAVGAPRLNASLGLIPVFIANLKDSFFADDKWIQMAWLFLKTGLFSFGGAYASLAFLQRGAVDQFHWVTAEQLLDGVALSVASPGPFMLFTTFVGYLAGGVTGAVIATFFVFLPSFVFVILGAKYIEQAQNNRSVHAFLAGISAGVVGVILVVSLELAPSALVGAPSILIALLAFALITFLKADVARVAIGTIIVGICYAVLQSV